MSDVITVQAAKLAVARAELALAEANLAATKPRPVSDELSAPALAEIHIELLTEGRVRLSSTCWGRFDSLYAPLLDDRVAEKAGVLLLELRNRLGSGSDVQHGHAVKKHSVTFKLEGRAGTPPADGPVSQSGSGGA